MKVLLFRPSLSFIASSTLNKVMGQPGLGQPKYTHLPTKKSLGVDPNQYVVDPLNEEGGNSSGVCMFVGERPREP